VVTTEQVMEARQDRDTTIDATSAPACALRDVFETHAPFVCRSLRQLGVSETDLDDVLQEVFVVVHRRLPDYRESGRARAWLYSICRRLSQAQRRKTRRPHEGNTPCVDTLCK